MWRKGISCSNFMAALLISCCTAGQKPFKGKRLMTDKTQRILSGVQPTGNLHLGNYLGAIRNWVRFQEGHECLFMLADLHAITVPQEPDKLRASVREVAAAYIACGIDPEKHAIFPQSSVAAHSELMWIFSCHTPLGWLNRMTQFKEKAGKHRDNAVLGLYSYPVLMAADILLYKATHVPVGEDQKQHIELTRDIAGAFNRHYGTEFFPVPEPVIMGEATRVMSLRDGKKKMSKSDESDYSRINMTDDADTIALKFRKAKSDMVEGISYDPENRPEVANLLNIYCALKNVTREQALAECEDKNFSAFKTMLTDMAVAHLSPITHKMRELLESPDYIDQVLARGAAKARDIAGETMKEVRDLVGFLHVSH
jgi:tryptophanyl-tRNA synthetase